MIIYKYEIHLLQILHIQNNLNIYGYILYLFLYSKKRINKIFKVYEPLLNNCVDVSFVLLCSTFSFNKLYTFVNFSDIKISHHQLNLIIIEFIILNIFFLSHIYIIVLFI